MTAGRAQPPYKSVSRGAIGRSRAIAPPVASGAAGGWAQERRRSGRTSPPPSAGAPRREGHARPGTEGRPATGRVPALRAAATGQAPGPLPPLGSPPQEAGQAVSAMPCGRWRRLRPPGASESGYGAGRPTERQMAQVEAARREVRHSPAPRSTPAPGRPAGRPFIVPQPPVRPLAPAPAQPATAASLCRRQAWRCPCRHSSVATILRDRAHGRSRARRPPCRPRFGAWTCAGCARPRALAKRPPGCAQIVLVKQNKQSSTLSTWATSTPPPPSTAGPMCPARSSSRVPRRAASPSSSTTNHLVLFELAPHGHALVAVKGRLPGLGRLEYGVLAEPSHCKATHRCAYFQQGGVVFLVLHGLPELLVAP